MEKKREIPIEQITENGFTYWVANTHIEEYPKEPTRLEVVWEMLKDWFKELLSKV